ncbi:hypothetical protein [Haloferula sp. BvORR071]|uniref:hypothetical protein n=1 Tax=Haloferula sp. BvORR071 TaxID=1396141 RepID=UPI00054DC005|nr:hypothetical protein [Haloferula sp. BvORR071]
MTDPDFTALLEDYRSFERGVMRVMEKECTPHCSVCPTPCCRTAICREAAESPFLLAVHGSRQAFDEKTGYLGARGCKLGVGRPPICHAFLCHRIMDAQPDDQRRYALDVLGELVGYVGKKVWLKRHLVEALDDADLRKTDRDLFRRRISAAAAAFEILEAYFAGERDLAQADLQVLQVIRK